MHVYSASLTYVGWNQFTPPDSPGAGPANPHRSSSEASSGDVDGRGPGV